MAEPFRMDLTGKVALVTGASSGLGRHFAELLARHGAQVTLAARRLEQLEEARKAIIAAGGSARTVRMDVADAQSVAQALAGGPVFDIVINNAGISGTMRALDVSEKDWDSVLDTNLKGTFLVAQACARLMREAGKGGSIVNIASILAHRVGGDLAAYAASKAGAVQLSKALALEWARLGIRVNALCPGYIETEINREFFQTAPGEALIKRIPQRRLGLPEELDGALMLLVSDAGRYITGTSIVVDGGHLCSGL